ncbi:MAG: hypothetical protein M1358_18335 [Chloroflexi bacterium]|nr:hypothetical protein [Chloroflexota bacterium]
MTNPFDPAYFLATPKGALGLFATVFLIICVAGFLVSSVFLAMARRRFGGNAFTAVVIELFSLAGMALFSVSLILFLARFTGAPGFGSRLALDIAGLLDFAFLVFAAGFFFLKYGKLKAEYDRKEVKRRYTPGRAPTSVVRSAAVGPAPVKRDDRRKRKKKR